MLLTCHRAKLGVMLQMHLTGAKWLIDLSFPVTTKKSATLSGEKADIWLHGKLFQLENIQEANEWSLYVKVNTRQTSN